MNIPNPSNLDAEQEFLGACLINPEIIKKSIVISDYFYSDKHCNAFMAMQSVGNRGEEITPLTVNAETKGLVLISDLTAWMDRAQIDGLWKSNQRLIIDAWKMRRIKNLGQTLLQGVFDMRDFDDLSGEAINTLQSIASGNDVEIKSYRDIIGAAYKAIEDRWEKGSISGVPTGITLLDEITDGLQEDELTLVAARPGIGKSAFAQGFLHYAASQAYACGLINLEMSDKQLGIRALSSRSRVPITLLKKAAFDASDWQRISNAAGPLAELPIYVQDSAFSDRKIVQVMYRLVYEKKCRVIVVDYIQLMEKEESLKNTSREREVASFSRTLKKTAKALHVPVVALAQINRASENVKDKRPGIHNLRESGALEADADRIILLHVPECSCGMALECTCGNRNALELIIGKGRNDPKGSVMVEWNGHTTSFGRSYRPGELPGNERGSQDARRYTEN